MDLLHDNLLRNFESPFAALILQVLVILAVARACGALVRRFGQPQVIGEILAGIFLGPSLLQRLTPELHAALFPPSSVERLQFLSGIGVLLFMFIVGLELDTRILRLKARAAFVISQASIAVPFALGVVLALLLFPQYGPRGTGVLAYALFMGVTMSITAFPVLARILQEQGLTRTPLGGLAITCAAVNDVTGWCLLALVVGLLQSGSGMGATWVIALSAAYTLLMLTVVRRFMSKHIDIAPGAELPPALLAFTVIALLLSAWITEMTGMHALFGAFLMGVIMPGRNGVRERLAARIHDVTALILLPLFFAVTGLRTQIGLLDDLGSWLICGLIVFIAVLGKFGGTAVAARLTGHTWRLSCILGALMNTRGLMELIVLNIGYELGILDPKIFTMMVIMAVATTMMTGPILRLLKPQSAPDPGRRGSAPALGFD